MMKDIIALAVPTSVKERRKLRGWTQSDLAEAAGVSTTAIHNLEAEKNGFTDKTLASIAVALHCRPADLLLPVESDLRVEGEEGVKALLRQIRGLPEEAINPLWRVIAGYIEDAAQSG